MSIKKDQIVFYYDSIALSSGPVFRRVKSSGPKVTRLEIEVGPNNWQPTESEKTPHLENAKSLCVITAEQHADFTRRCAEQWETLMGVEQDPQKRWSLMSRLRAGILQHCFGPSPVAPLSAADRRYLRKVGLSPYGLNDRQSGWAAASGVRNSLQRRGLVKVTRHQACGMGDVSGTVCEITDAGRAALKQ